MKHPISLSLLFLLVFPFQISIAQEVDGGNGHSIMLDLEGVVWTVGRNDHGQIGDGTYEDRSVPVAVAGLPKIVRISRGYDHSLAIDENGSIWGWGRNNYGQLCNQNLQDHNKPKKMQLDGEFVSVEGGLWHTVALKADGSVWAWGHNFNAELGSGNREHSTFALAVRTNGEDGLSGRHLPLSGIVDIKSVGHHGLALDSLGRIWAWGNNGSYQLGHEKRGIQPYARLINGIPGIEAIASGWHHNLALDSAGRMWQWGADQSFMKSGTRGYIKSPQLVENVPAMSQVACGSWHSMSVDVTGQVWTWGYNKKGMLGNMNSTSSAFPVKAEGMSCAQSIGAGCFQSLVVDSLGDLYSFGGNHNGQLAANHQDHVFIPTQTLFSMVSGSQNQPDQLNEKEEAENLSGPALQRIWLIVSPFLLVLLLAWNVRLRKLRPAIA